VVEGDDVEGAAAPYTLRLGAQVGSVALGTTWLYTLGSQLLNRFQTPFVREGWMSKLPGPLSRWTMARPFPAFAADFRRWWRSRSGGA
jgi:hypothetical protein